MILAIDPGNEKTGWAIMDGKNIFDFGISANSELLEDLDIWNYNLHKMYYEMIACYGMPVGREVFDTCVWIGRFMQAFGADDCKPVFRRDVKLHLCNSTRAKDANVRQAILDMYEPTGGGTTPQIGTKKQPGPLYGVKSHIWPAIGVGLTGQNILS
jgi:hypothetical protein